MKKKISLLQLPHYWVQISNFRNCKVWKQKSRCPLQGTDWVEAASERPAISHMWSSFQRTVLEMFIELWGGGVWAKPIYQYKERKVEEKRFSRAKNYSNWNRKFIGRKSKQKYERISDHEDRTERKRKKDEQTPEGCVHWSFVVLFVSWCFLDCLLFC